MERMTRRDRQKARIKLETKEERIEEMAHEAMDRALRFFQKGMLIMGKTKEEVGEAMIGNVAHNAEKMRMDVGKMAEALGKKAESIKVKVINPGHSNGEPV